MDLSVVIPIKDERDNLRPLHERLRQAVDPLGLSYELVFVDDGSGDGSYAVLESLAAADARVKVVRLRRNYGQTAALQAGIDWSCGAVLVTMDGDLQNEPEDIPKLVAAVEGGADVASGRRTARRDSWGRTLPSRLINGMLRRFTGVAISDFGCALNAYRRRAVEPMLGSIGRQKFTKALVLSGGASVVEVDVAHAARQGASRYSPLRLTRLALHVLAGFWPQPIQWIGLLTTAGTPAEVIERINREVNRALRDPDLIAKFAQQGISPAGGTPADFQRAIATDLKNWTEIARAANIKAE